MTPNLTVKVILGTTREGRFGDTPAHWILGEAAKHPGVEAELCWSYCRLSCSGSRAPSAGDRYRG
jgi:hypothetical protein